LGAEKKLSVLVVDGEPSLVRVAEGYPAQDGFVVRTAMADRLSRWPGAPNRTASPSISACLARMGSRSVVDFGLSATALS
jgi:hypothetical protein